jgi:hypothetical protein
MAQVLIPTSTQSNIDERWKKTRFFLAYVLGFQHSAWIAPSKASRKFDKRIEGDTNSFGVSWMWSHQVAGYSKGNVISKVSGPGTVFTDESEAPVVIVDLRPQLRISKVDAITKDGINIPIVIFIAFAIDRENFADNFSVGTKSYEIDHRKGTFPYSSSRVRSVLNSTGVNWDDWAVDQVEQVARQVVAGRSVDELWLPRKDRLGISALDEIGDELKELLSPKLAKAGINLFAARIVNYELDNEDQVVQQNLKAWASYWEQQIRKAEADIETIYEKEIKKARSYSLSNQLGLFSSMITKARSIHSDLPRHLVAHYFTHLLDEFIRAVPGMNINEAKQRIDKIKEYMLYSGSEDEE